MPKRDAIHVAYIEQVAAMNLDPGEHLEHGVVDPFLKRQVLRGETYRLFMFPGTTNDLHHNWSHPAFPDEKDRIIEKLNEELDSDSCRGCYD